MRTLIFLAAISALIISSSAFAGTVSYRDMSGKWQSTKCTAPQTYVLQGSNSETPANDLNAQQAQRNAFIQTAHNYMTCISQEAERDAQATGMLVTQTAKAIIDQTQAQIDAIISKSNSARTSD